MKELSPGCSNKTLCPGLAGISLVHPTVNKIHEVTKITNLRIWILIIKFTIAERKDR